MVEGISPSHSLPMLAMFRHSPDINHVLSGRLALCYNTISSCFLSHQHQSCSAILEDVTYSMLRRTHPKTRDASQMMHPFWDASQNDLGLLYCVGLGASVSCVISCSVYRTCRQGEREVERGQIKEEREAEERQSWLRNVMEGSVSWVSLCERQDCMAVFRRSPETRQNTRGLWPMSQHARALTTIPWWKKKLKK